MKYETLKNLELNTKIVNKLGNILTIISKYHDNLDDGKIHVKLHNPSYGLYKIFSEDSAELNQYAIHSKNDFSGVFVYVYKGNKYLKLGNTSFKHPETRKWITSVLYSDIDGTGIYVRELEEFNKLFKKYE